MNIALAGSMGTTLVRSGRIHLKVIGGQHCEFLCRGQIRPFRRVGGGFSRAMAEWHASWIKLLDEV
jgi:hypothetical protein